MDVSRMGEENKMGRNKMKYTLKRNGNKKTLQPMTAIE